MSENELCADLLDPLFLLFDPLLVRFENEEKELNRFVEFLKDKYPEEFATWNDASSVNDVVDKIKDSLVLRAAKDPTCPCHCPPQVGSLVGRLVAWLVGW